LSGLVSATTRTKYKMTDLDQRTGHIFISYSSQQQDYARMLASYLIQNGFDVWLDDRIEYGEDWWQAIVKAIRGCSALIVIMSPTAYASRWVQREVQLADNQNKAIFPLLLEGDNWERFVLTQFVDVLNKQVPPAEFLDRLGEVVARGQTPGKYISAPTAPPKPASLPKRASPSTTRLLAVIGAVAVTAGAALFGISKLLPALSQPTPTQVALAATSTHTAAPVNTLSPTPKVISTATPLVALTAVDSYINSISDHKYPISPIYDTFWAAKDVLGLPAPFEYLPVELAVQDLPKLPVNSFGPNTFAFRNWQAFYKYIGGMHNGYDWIVPTGTPLKAVCDGVVVGTQQDWPFLGNPTDNTLTIWCFLPQPAAGKRMMSNVLVAYAHLSDNTRVKRHDIVSAGQQIGLSGSPAGEAANAHLHLEIHLLSGDTKLLKTATRRLLSDYNHDQPFDHNVPWNPLFFFSPRLARYLIQQEETLGFGGSLGYPAGVDLHKSDLDGLYPLNSFTVVYYEYGIQSIWTQGTWPDGVVTDERFPDRLKTFIKFEPYPTDFLNNS
jgi:murein DD-endopeptidase MepM/ murein hydrolase activator NlpD